MLGNIKKEGAGHYYFLNQDKIILFLIISKEIHPMNRPNSSNVFSFQKGLEPESVIRLVRANEAIFLSSVSSLLGYNGTPLRPQCGKTSVQK